MFQSTPLLSSPDRSRSAGALLAIGGAVLVAVAAQAEIPMVPVPMSLQTLAISIVGLTLGARLGAAALVLYLMAGAMGLPVFSGGASGAAHLAGPTGGFLFGFVAMAWMSGWLAERGFARGFGRLFVAAFVPAVLLFVPGVAWLWAVTPLDLPGAVAAGMTPFLLGATVKALIAAMVVSGGWRARRG